MANLQFDYNPGTSPDRNILESTDRDPSPKTKSLLHLRKLIGDATNEQRKVIENLQKCNDLKETHNACVRLHIRLLRELSTKKFGKAKADLQSLGASNSAKQDVKHSEKNIQQLEKKQLVSPSKGYEDLDVLIHKTEVAREEVLAALKAAEEAKKRHRKSEEALSGTKTKLREFIKETSFSCHPDFRDSLMKAKSIVSGQF